MTHDIELSPEEIDALPPQERRAYFLHRLQVEFSGGAPVPELGPHTGPLELPDYFSQHALKPEPGMGEPERLACHCALLFASWPKNVTWPGKPRPRGWRLGESVLDHGRAVYNSLREAGYTHGQIVDAGNLAARYRTYRQLDADDVQAAADFCAARAAG